MNQPNTMDDWIDNLFAEWVEHDGSTSSHRKEFRDTIQAKMQEVDRAARIDILQELALTAGVNIEVNNWIEDRLASLEGGDV